MDASNEAVLISSIVPVIGVLSVAAARLGPRGAFRAMAQWVLLAVFVAVVGATFVAVSLGSGHWLAHGATLSAMAIGSIVDFGRPGAVRLS